MSCKLLSFYRPFAAAAVAATILVGGCASPSERISGALGGYGLNATQAVCVGQRLERNLSITQLQQLAQAARAYTRNDTSPGRLTGADLFRVASQIRDPQIAIEVARAASGCGVISSVL